MRLLLFLSLPLYALDQLTKWLIRVNIPYGSELPVIPGIFSLVHAANTGAAFSMFTGNNTFFIGLAIVALVIIVFLLVRYSSPKSGAYFNIATKLALALLVSGILGNLTDRVLRGAVTDFLHFYLREYAWPSFNVADSCICVAAGLLVLSSLSKSKSVNS